MCREVVNGEDGVRVLGHELLAEVVRDESVGPDHADGAATSTSRSSLPPLAGVGVGGDMISTVVRVSRSRSTRVFL